MKITGSRQVIFTMLLLLSVLATETECRRKNNLKDVKITGETRNANKVGPRPRAIAIRAVFHSRQLHVSTKGDLGPLFLSNNGKEFGFFKTWDKNMLLTNNRHAVQIQANGLYIITAQLKYESTEDEDNTDPVSFKIHVRKLKRRDASSRAPIALTECVRPSLKRFEVATCNTMAMAELEKGDEISLFHVSPQQITVDANPASSYLNVLRVDRL